MSSQFEVVIELPEGSCSPQELEQILAQVKNFFDRLSNGLRESAGQRLIVTIGPWEAQHRRWAGEFSVDASQSLLNNASAQTLPLDSLVKHAALGSSPVQPGGVHTLVQQQGQGGQFFKEEGHEFDQYSAQGANSGDLNILFPDHDFGIRSDGLSSPFKGQSYLCLDPLQGFDINGQSLPPSPELMPSNATNPSNTREIYVLPQIGDETLIRRAADSLAARPLSEYATSPRDLYAILRWETPRSPADYLTLGPGRPNKSRSPSPSRKRG
ncbi:MAG: hypothetical protein ASARMPREDX12_002096 [Alectoria sarmentosa]|nr:MAG: hypothetical protein ASARMPREDX12_002096 [Alectoria sarmentosa]